MKIEGLELPNGLEVTNPVHVDSWYGPYASIAEANATVPGALRSVGTIAGTIVGRTVGIVIAAVANDYWWSGGVADGNLVLKNANNIPYSYAANTITNGLIVIALAAIPYPKIVVYYDGQPQNFTANLDDNDNPTQLTINIGTNPQSKTTVILS